MFGTKLRLPYETLYVEQKITYRVWRTVSEEILKVCIINDNKELLEIVSVNNINYKL